MMSVLLGLMCLYVFTEVGGLGEAHIAAWLGAPKGFLAAVRAWGRVERRLHVRTDIK